MAKLNFGGVEENVVTREEFPLSKAQEVLKDEVIAIIGYGVQGPAQALNLKDNGINVIVGQAPEFKEDWDKAIRDGFVPGKSLFTIEEAAEDGWTRAMKMNKNYLQFIQPLQQIIFK